MDTELILAHVVLALSLVALLVGFVVWRIADTSGASPPCSSAPPPWPHSLQWMVTLTMATACLLSVQMLLAISIGSLALLADSAHSAADFASYTLTSFVEYLKFRFGVRAINSKASAQLDRASAGFSVLIVLATSLCVCGEAVRRLRATGQAEEEGLGSAMLVVAGLGMVLNGGMLGLKMWMNSQPNVCPPCPTPKCDNSLDARAQRLLDAREGKSGCPPSCQPKDERERQNLRPGAGAGQTPRPQPSASATDVQPGLHDMIHPGCQGGSCGSREQNLNVSGVVLHVGSDVVRTLLMFITGALLRAGVLRNSAAVDAVSSCLIAGCVTLGCAWMLGRACKP